MADAFRLVWREDGAPCDASHETFEDAKADILRLAELGQRPFLYQKLEYEVEISVRLKVSPAGPQAEGGPPSPPPVEPVGDVGHGVIGCSEPGCGLQWHTPDVPHAKPKDVAPKPPRNVPATCIVDGCTEKGSARNQWICAGHARGMNLQQRQAALSAFKEKPPRAAPSEPTPGVAP